MLYYYDSDDTTSVTYTSLAAYDRVVVTSNAHILATGGAHVFALNIGDRIDVSGELVAENSAIFGATGSNSNQIHILQGGIVISANDLAIDVTGNNNEVYNSGTIDGRSGIELTGSGERLINQGEILSFYNGVALGNDDGAGAFVNNSGTISATQGEGLGVRSSGVTSVVNSGHILAGASAIDVLSGSLNLTNTGLIQSSTRAVFGDAGDDTVTNSGMIVGNVDLLGGDDTYDGTGGTIVGLVMGGNGNDTLIGGAGRDQLYGNNDDDQLSGAAGDDRLVGGFGADDIDGGDGRDTASYRNSGAVTLDLDDATLNTGAALGDTFTSIELYEGSENDDQLFGTATGNDTLYGFGGNDLISGRDGNDILLGQAGDDIIIGGRGNDRINGGDGIDTASYVDATSLVKVSLAIVGPQNTLGAGLDTLVAFENLTGSGFNDQLTGNASANVLSGGNGNDKLDGGDGNDRLIGGAGDDMLIGGLGVDTVDYSAIATMVTVDLSNAAAQNTGTGAGTDTLSSIENAIGGGGNDMLSGSTLANVLSGGIGDDTLNGGDGDDTLIGGIGNDTLNGGNGFDTADYSDASALIRIKLTTVGPQATGGSGNDTFNSVEGLVGSNFDDSLVGDNNANTIEGGVGNDFLNGLGGIDTASYQHATAGVTVDISVAANTAQNTIGAGVDTLNAFESILGSAFDDILTGNSVTNRLDGGTGNDMLSGLGGNDTLVGGAGTDHLDGGDNNDMLSGGAGDDILFGGEGNDTLSGGENGDYSHYEHNTFDGWNGLDTLTFAASSYGVYIALSGPNKHATDEFGYYEYDTILSIETFVGSAFHDDFSAGTAATTFTGGAGADYFEFNPGTAQGDTITDFSGAAGQGDHLYFTGFNADAVFSRIDSQHYQIHSDAMALTEIITFSNGVAINIANDVSITP